MPVNYFVNVRQQLKLQLLEFIKANKDKTLRQLFALFSLKTGLKVSTIQTYFDELKDANMILEDELRPNIYECVLCQERIHTFDKPIRCTNPECPSTKFEMI